MQEPINHLIFYYSHRSARNAGVVQVTDIFRYVAEIQIFLMCFGVGGVVGETKNKQKTWNADLSKSEVSFF